MAKNQKSVTILTKGSLVYECLNDSAVYTGTEELIYKPNAGGQTCTVKRDDSYKSFTSVIIPREVILTNATTKEETGYFVTSIASSAFSSCTNLTSIVIGDNITSIEKFALSNCTNLESVVIGDNVTSIGDYALGGISNSASIFYKGTEEDWEAIDKTQGNNFSATLYYYSETQPTEVGNYWYYVNGEPTVWEEAYFEINGNLFKFERDQTWIEFDSKYDKDDVFDTYENDTEMGYLGGPIFIDKNKSIKVNPNHKIISQIYYRN